jgi:hypothetical protein
MLAAKRKVRLLLCGRYLKKSTLSFRIIIFQAKDHIVWMLMYLVKLVTGLIVHNPELEEGQIQGLKNYPR